MNNIIVPFVTLTKLYLSTYECISYKDKILSQNLIRRKTNGIQICKSPQKPFEIVVAINSTQQFPNIAGKPYYGNPGFYRKPTSITINGYMTCFTVNLGLKKMQNNISKVVLKICFFLV